MAEVSRLLSALDESSALNPRETSGLNGISAAKVSEALPALNSTGTLNAGRIVQDGQHLNGMVS